MLRVDPLLRLHHLHICNCSHLLWLASLAIFKPYLMIAHSFCSRSRLLSGSILWGHTGGAILGFFQGFITDLDVLVVVLGGLALVLVELFDVRQLHVHNLFRNN